MHMINGYKFSEGWVPVRRGDVAGALDMPTYHVLTSSKMFDTRCGGHLGYSTSFGLNHDRVSHAAGQYDIVLFFTRM